MQLWKGKVPYSCITIIDASCQKVPESASIQKGKEKFMVPHLVFYEVTGLGKEKEHVLNLTSTFCVIIIAAAVGVCVDGWMQRDYTLSSLCFKRSALICFNVR